MTTNDLIISFIKLDDDAKQRIIEELKKQGYPKADIAGLVWLAAMSNSTTKELMFNGLNPTL